MKKKYLKVLIVGLLLTTLLSLVGCKTQEGDYANQKVTCFDEEIKLKEVSPSALLSYVPEKKGFEFLGWYFDKAHTQPITSAPKKSCQAFAKWKILSYTVTFYVEKDGAIIPVDGKNTQEITYNESAIAPTPPKKEGFYFVKWSEDFSKVSQNLKIYAIYAQNKMIACFDGETQIAEKNADEFLDFCPQKEGHTFLGWFFDAETTQPILNITSDLDKAYSKWEKLQYKVVFYDHLGKEISVLNKPYQMIEHGAEAVAPSEPKKEGYKFVEWDKEFSCVKSNLDISPLFNPLKTTLEYFDMQGNLIYSIQKQTEDDLTIVLNTAKSKLPIEDDFLFDFWCSDRECLIPAVLAEKVLAKEETQRYYAKYKLDEILDAKINSNQKSFVYAKDAIVSMEASCLQNTKLSYSYQWFLGETKLNNEVGASLSKTGLNSGSYEFVAEITASYPNMAPQTKRVSYCVTVSKADLTGLSFGGETGLFEKTYDTQPINFSVDGLMANDTVYYSLDNNKFSLEKPSIVDSGSCNVYAKIARKNYNELSLCATIKINKAALCVKPQDFNVAYGDKMPENYAFMVDTNQLKGNDDISVVEGLAQFSNSAFNTHTIGEFEITIISGLSSKNYELQLGKGKFLVSKRLSVATINNETVTYGDAVPAFTISFSNLVAVDTISYSGLAFSTDYQKGQSTGEYKITFADKIVSDYYEIGQIVEGQLFVQPKQAKITAKDANVIYGDNLAELGANVEGLVDGDIARFTVSSDYIVGDEVSTARYTKVTLSAEDKNYNYTLVDGSVSILPRAITVSAQNKNIEFGQTVDLNNGYSITNDIAQSGLSFVLQTPYIVGDGVGKYEINFQTQTLQNYTVTYVPGELTVSAKPISVVWEYSDNFIYNGAEQNADVHAYYLNIANQKVVLQAKVDKAFLNAGSYRFYVENADANYNIQNLNQDVVMNQRQIFVKAKAIEGVSYGSEIPELTYETTGLVAGDIINVDLSTDYIKGSKVGTYQIFASSSDTLNYKIKCENAGLTVIAKEITLKVNEEFIYKEGELWSKNSWGLALYGGAVLNGTLKANYGEVGTYTSTANKQLGTSFSWLNGYNIMLDADNVTDCYTIKYDICLNVILRSFNFVTDNGPYTYDGSNHQATIKNIDSQVGETKIYYSLNKDSGYSEIAPSFKNAGTYVVYFNIVPTSAEYSNERGSFEVIVNQRVLKITANDSAITYGETADISLFSATVSGLVAGDDEVKYSLTSPYKQYQDVEEYAINVAATSYDQNNYKLETVAGKLQVGQKSATVKVCDKNVEYGSDYGSLAIERSGFVGADTFEFIVSVASFDSKATVGTVFVASAQPQNLKNYNIQYQSGAVTIIRRNVTVVWENLSLTYNGANQKDIVTASFTDVDGVKQNLIVESLYEIKTANLTGYDVNANTTSFSDCYSFEKTAEKVIVNKAILKVCARDATVVFGDSINDYIVDYSGFLVSDNIDNINKVGDAVVSCEYVKGNNVGKYDIVVNCANLASTNYTFSANNGKLNVAPKVATVVWSGASEVYRYNGTSQKDSLSAKIIGINGDINVNITVSGADTSFCEVGQYTFSAALNDANYSLTNTQISVEMKKGVYANISSTAVLNEQTEYSPDRTLAAFTLPSGYYWVNQNIVPTCDVTAYDVYYNGDSLRYENYTGITATLIQKKATCQFSGDNIVSVDFGQTAIVSPVIMYNGVALSSALFEFSYSNSNTFSDAGTFRTLVGINSNNYTVEPKYYYAKVKSVDVGGVKYTIEDALNTATSGTIKLTTSTAFADFNDIYNNGSFYTVKTGVTLLLPYSSTDTKGYLGAGENGGNGDYAAHPENYSGGKALYISLFIPHNVDLIVSGTAIVGAMTASKVAGTNQNAVSGGYCEINLAGNIILNNATLRVMGYIKGDGVITANSSTVIENLVLTGWMGGTISTARYAGDGYSISATKILGGGNLSMDNPCQFPFSQYELRSIQTRLVLNYGSKLQGYTKIATLEQSMIITIKAQINEAYLTFVTSSANVSDGLLRLTTGSKIIKTFNSSRVGFDVYGTVNDGFTSISMVVIGCTANMSSEKVIFPVDGRTDITLKNGAVFNQSYSYKLMPGATLTVEQGSTYNVNSGASLIAYTKEFDDISTYPYPGQARGDAKVYINGTMNINGAFGGNIEATSDGGKVVVNANATLSVTSKEGNNNGSGRDGISYVFKYIETDTVTKSAVFVNKDATTVTALVGKTYTYSNGIWS